MSFTDSNNPTGNSWQVILQGEQGSDAENESLTLIPLPLRTLSETGTRETVPGFERFLGSWLVRSHGMNVLVDCGVTGSYGALKTALDELSVTPDLLLLTHVHLDHAGAAGCLCRDFPAMKVFCFEKAGKHLISPEKLWNATAVTLGQNMASAYQAPLPVPAERIITREELPQGWKVINTPGHAAHHVSFFYNLLSERLCFSGEALGITTGSGSESWFSDGQLRPVLRPATPPKYVAEISTASIHAIDAEDWTIVCTGHCAASRNRTLPAQALQQLSFWEEQLQNVVIQNGMSETEAVEHMLRADPQLANLQLYTDSARCRETYFLRNSVRGFTQYLSEKNALA